MSSSFIKALKDLESWFDRQKRVLPWRDAPTLYRVWVSEIMLQQTQVITVLPYFERFMARFPTVQSLADSSTEDVLLHWAGLGYYSRARNLHQAAKQILERGFPDTREGWTELPGIGPYTAGAILSIALDQPEAILDGNVERVLSRVRRVDRLKGDAAFKARLWRLSKIFVERAHENSIRPSTLNQALMELGATVCTPKKPRCAACPLSEICRAKNAGEAESFPPRKKPKAWIEVREEMHCLLGTDGRVLVRQRAAGEWRAGLWDLLTDAPRARKLGTVETRHVVTRHKIKRVTHVWAADHSRWAVAESTDTRWIDPSSPGVAVGSALKKTLAVVRERFPEALPRS